MIIWNYAVVSDWSLTRRAMKMPSFRRTICQTKGIIPKTNVNIAIAIYTWWGQNTHNANAMHCGSGDWLIGAVASELIVSCCILYCYYSLPNISLHRSTSETFQRTILVTNYRFSKFLATKELAISFQICILKLKNLHGKRRSL